MLKFVHDNIVEVPDADAMKGIIFTMNPDSDAERQARDRFYGEPGTPARDADTAFRKKWGVK